jgi:hypothetical protein
MAKTTKTAAVKVAEKQTVATAAKRVREAKSLPRVEGSARWLRRIGELNDEAGEIQITTTTGSQPEAQKYILVLCAGGWRLYSWDAAKKECVSYHLPADLHACTCLDHVHNSARRADGKCKHQRALEVLGLGKKSE